MSDVRSLICRCVPSSLLLISDDQDTLIRTPLCCCIRAQWIPTARGRCLDRLHVRREVFCTQMELVQSEFPLYRNFIQPENIKGIFYLCATLCAKPSRDVNIFLYCMMNSWDYNSEAHNLSLVSLLIRSCMIFVLILLYKACYNNKNE